MTQTVAPNRLRSQSSPAVGPLLALSEGAEEETAEDRQHVRCCAPACAAAARRGAYPAVACLAQGAAPRGRHRRSGARRRSAASRRRSRAPAGERWSRAAHGGGVRLLPEVRETGSRGPAQSERRRGNRPEWDRRDLRAIRPHLLGDDRARNTLTLLGEHPSPTPATASPRLCGAPCKRNALQSDIRGHDRQSPARAPPLQQGGAPDPPFLDAGGRDAMRRALTRRRGIP